ncbi:HK97 family phage prohead protease [Methylobacterium sp. UNC378MF]|uniref:HK97 family phage prohead protease n=1 Tax=Methylobacterium sp. UNC378MF TaxID=1502748 RepID=UPI00244EBC92|nr:HK97 family phage prohead protease [Methylobacterium sp. UNC378MF]
MEIVWTTGASVRRYDWWDGTEYDEVLSVEPKAIRLERLNLGAPFLDSHCSYGCDNVIGAVVPGSAKIEDGRGLARIQLSKAPGVADTVQKIREGVIRNVSVGYWVHKVEKTEADDGTVARWDVVDWEPLEISAVPIPADAASQIRSDQAEGDGPKLRACLVVTRTPASGPSPKARGESPMATKPVKPKSQRAKSPAELEAEKKRLAEARRRAAEQRAARDDESETDEDAEGDAERDEDQDEERDGDDAEDGDAGSDDERDGDDHAEDDEDRDGDDEDDGEGERAAPKPAKRKALTPAEVRRAAEAAVRADRVRGAKIREIAKQFGFPNLGERHANGETSVRAFKDLVLERLAARQAKRSSTTFAAASTAGVGEEYRGATPPARDVEKGAAEARALLGKK